MLPIDPRKLETFRVVALAGRISEAARLLHLSQPAVSAQVRELEHACGRPLFVRSARGVRLNAEGLRLLAHAQRVEEALRSAAEIMQEPSDQGEELVLGASQTTAAFLVPRLLAEFKRTQRGLAARVAVGNTRTVLEWLADGAVPLGLVEGLPRAPRVRLERFLQDELIPVASNSAPRSFARVRSPSDLDGVPIVWREEGSGTRVVVERALRRAGLRARSRGEDLSFGANDAVKAAVLLGLGVGFLSRWTIRPELEAGQLRVLPIAGLKITRAFYWALPAGGVRGVAGRFLREARVWRFGEGYHTS